MPNRRKYKTRTSFNTAFEAEFLEAFSKKCAENGKDRNEILVHFMEEYLKSDNESREQQILNPLNLPLAGNGKGSTLHPITEDILTVHQEEKKSFKMPTQQELIDELKNNCKTPQSVGTLWGVYSQGLKTVKTWMDKIKQDNLRAEIMR